jgi:hypothetical protein
VQFSELKNGVGWSYRIEERSCGMIVTGKNQVPDECRSPGALFSEDVELSVYMLAGIDDAEVCIDNIAVADRTGDSGTSDVRMRSPLRG